MLLLARGVLSTSSACEEREKPFPFGEKFLKVQRSNLRSKQRGPVRVPGSAIRTLMLHTIKTGSHHSLLHDPELVTSLAGYQVKLWQRVDSCTSSKEPSKLSS
eukprot:5261434-Amphidinium_carterae.1